MGKFSGKNVTAITGHLGQLPMVVQVYHGQNQPYFPNHCQPFNGHCSHLCLPAPRISQTMPTTSCACPDDMKLSKDWRTCVAKNPAKKTSTTTAPVPQKKKPITTRGTTSRGMKSETTETPILHHGEADVKPVAQENSSLSVVAILSTILGLAALVLLGGLFVLHRRRQAKQMATIKFDNPAFRRPEGSVAAKESRISTIDMTNQQVKCLFEKIEYGTTLKRNHEERSRGGGLNLLVHYQAYRPSRLPSHCPHKRGTEEDEAQDRDLGSPPEHASTRCGTGACTATLRSWQPK